MTTAKKTTKKVAVKKVEPVHVKQDKKEVIKTHQVHAKDTGSAPVQIAILTEKINTLSSHLKLHPQDKHSRRGLIGMVGKRRKLLKYLQITSQSMYTKIVQALKLRK